MALFANDAFVEDGWRPMPAEGASIADGDMILTLPQWRDLGAGFAPGRRLGLRLEPAAPLGEIAGELARFSLIALNFPKYTDGRAYSMARQIRKLGYTGELRATGNVLFDQLQLMARCGFDSFEISHLPTLRLLRDGRRPLVSRFYQPGFGAEAPAGTRPWARRVANANGMK